MPRQSTYRSEVLTSNVEQTAVIAAAKNYSVGKKRSGKSAGQLGEAWQETAWDFYDIVPEFRYSADFVGNLLSRATLYVTKDGEATDDEIPVQTLASLFGGPEGQSEMLKMLGINYTVAGDGLIIGNTSGSGEDEWAVVATTEVRRDSAGGFAVTGGHVTIKHGKTLSIKLWHEHPRQPWKSNSPARACLPVLAELDKLTQHVAAQIDSRLSSAGILWVPQEMSFPTSPVTEVDEEGNETTSVQQGSSAQALADMIKEVAEIAIRDRSDASALVPIIVQVAGEYLDKIDKTEFWTGLDEKAIEMRNEAIRRLALGMDMPPEVLTGVSDSNHWNAWQADEAAIKIHAEPLLSAITSALTTGYLRKVLASDMSQEEADRYAIAADTSRMRVRPNRSQEAIELYDRGELSGAVVRRETGFDEQDAMSDAERIQWLTKKLAQGQTTPELVALGLQLLGVEVPEGMILGETEGETHEQRPTPSLIDHPTRDIPEPPPELVASSEMMVFRALERAGNRLKTKLNGRTPTGVAAKDLYLHVPKLSAGEVDDLLADAWNCTEWTDLSACSPSDLEQVLNRYTHALLALQKPHDQDLLRVNLHELTTAMV